jgi:hypothetical protein
MPRKRLLLMQELAVLLRRLKTEGHKALIFTQMARMLDILEVGKHQESLSPSKRNVLHFTVLNTGCRYEIYLLLYICKPPC